MAYLGNNLQAAYSSYLLIDSLSASFNGTTTSFALKVNGVAPVPFPLNEQNVLISVGGVPQKPDPTGAEGFKFSGTNIVFSSAPKTGESFWGVVLAGADYVNVGVTYPDGDASTPSITFNSTKTTGLYLAGSSTLGFATAGVLRSTIDSNGNLSILSAGSATIPAVAVGTGTTYAPGIYSPGTDQVALSTNGVVRLTTSTTAVSSALAIDHPLGAAGTPSITFTGDLNTGIYSPGADQVAISTSGTGRLFVDASGNVGVATGSPGASLHVAGAITSTPTGSGLLAGINSNYGQAKLYGSTGGILDFGASGADANARLLVNNSDSALQFYTNSGGSLAERMRLTAAGLLGLGTSSPSGKLNILQDSTSNTTPAIRITGSTGDPTNYFLDVVPILGGSTVDYRFDLKSISTNTALLYLSGAGRVGIGTTSPAGPLDVNGEVYARGGVSVLNGTTQGGSIVASAAGRLKIRSYNATGADGGETIFVRNNTSVELETARFDASGRLLVGTSSAISTINYAGLDRTPRLQVVGDDVSNGSFAIIRTQTAPVLFFGGGTSGTNVASGNGIGSIVFTGYHTDKYYTAASIDAAVDGTPGSGDMPGRLVFSTTADGAASPTERMRITNAGYVWINRTSAPSTPNSLLAIDGGSINLCAIFNRDVDDDSIRFTRSNTTVGSISVTTTATAYNTSSDYRLKENVVSLTGAVDRLNQLQVHRFNFFADPDKTVDGFIAHEAQAVVPECVTGEKDAVDADGNPVYQGIDQSKLVPLLTAALQEAIAKIEALEADVAALKGA
jgi:hypothetical protein